MSDLFKKKPLGQRRMIRYEILLSQGEAEEIRSLARIRNLSMADYMRRAALGRRADTRFETETVLALREVVQSIRQLCAAQAKERISPSDELGTLIDKALAAMLRISM